MYVTYCTSLRDDRTLSETDKRRNLLDYNRELRKSLGAGSTPAPSPSDPPIKPHPAPRSSTTGYLERPELRLGMPLDEFKVALSDVKGNLYWQGGTAIFTYQGPYVDGQQADIRHEFEEAKLAKSQFAMKTEATTITWWGGSDGRGQKHDGTSPEATAKACQLYSDHLSTLVQRFGPPLEGPTRHQRQPTIPTCSDPKTNCFEVPKNEQTDTSARLKLPGGAFLKYLKVETSQYYRYNWGPSWDTHYGSINTFSCTLQTVFSRFRNE